jgi:Ca2+-binding EF-hand superfamily protein
MWRVAGDAARLSSIGRTTRLEGEDMRTSFKGLVRGLGLAAASTLSLTACTDTLVSLEDAAAASALTDGDTSQNVEDAAGAPPHGPPPLAPNCAMPTFEERVLDEYDTDDDGTLSSQEHEALASDFEGDEGPPPPGMGPPPPQGEGDHPPPPFGPGGRGRRAIEFLLWVYDGDADGALSAEERDEMNADLEAGCEARRARLLEDFDADSDGALSDSELQAAQQALEAERRARFEELRDQVDADDDGVITDAEHQAARAAHEAERQAEREALDTDGDGTLSASEESVLKEGIKAHIRNGDPPPPPPPPGFGPPPGADGGPPPM